MMISPDSYIMRFKDSDYNELIKERDRLIEWIREYEENEKKGDRSGEEWKICPSPDVRYQCNLEYLAKLCNLMQARYNTEYVWGGKSLKVFQDE